MPFKSQPTNPDLSTTDRFMPTSVHFQDSILFVFPLSISNSQAILRYASGQRSLESHSCIDS